MNNTVVASTPASRALIASGAALAAAEL